VEKQNNKYYINERCEKMEILEKFKSYLEEKKTRDGKFKICSSKTCDFKELIT